MLPPPRSTLFPYTTLFRSEVFEPRRGAAADPKDRIPRIVRRADQAGEMRPRGILVGVRAGGPRALQDERVFRGTGRDRDRKSTRLNSSHQIISYAVFCLKK